MDTPLTPALAAHSRLRQTLILLAALYLLSSLALLAWRALGLHEAEVLFLQGPGLRSSLLWGGGLPLEAVKQLLFGRGLVLLLPLLVLAEEGLWRGLLLSALLELGMAPAWAIPTGARAPPASLQIRPYGTADWPGAWALLEPVFRGGETFPHDPAITDAEARVAWLLVPTPSTPGAKASAAGFVSTPCKRPGSWVFA